MDIDFCRRLDELQRMVVELRTPSGVEPIEVIEIRYQAETRAED